MAGPLPLLRDRQGVRRRRGWESSFRRSWRADPEQVTARQQGARSGAALARPLRVWPGLSVGANALPCRGAPMSALGPSVPAIECRKVADPCRSCEDNLTLPVRSDSGLWSLHFQCNK